MCIGFPQAFLFSVVFDGGNKALRKVRLQLGCLSCTFVFNAAISVSAVRSLFLKVMLLLSLLRVRGFRKQVHFRGK